MTVDNIVCLLGGRTKIRIENVIYQDIYWQGIVEDWLADNHLRKTLGDNEAHSMTVLNETDELIIYIQ